MFIDIIIMMYQSFLIQCASSCISQSLPLKQPTNDKYQYQRRNKIRSNYNTQSNLTFKQKVLEELMKHIEQCQKNKKPTKQKEEHYYSTKDNPFKQSDSILENPFEQNNFQKTYIVNKTFEPNNNLFKKKETISIQHIENDYTLNLLNNVNNTQYIGPTHTLYDNNDNTFDFFSDGFNSVAHDGTIENKIKQLEEDNKILKAKITKLRLENRTM